MEIIPVRLDVLHPPKDDLFSKIEQSGMSPEEHDVIAVSSKVVSIAEGRCVPKESREQKEALIQKESDWYLPREHVPDGHVIHTISRNQLVASAGIDPFGGHYILWPENPMRSAEELCAWFRKEYKKEHLYTVITDSKSMPMRRGVVGCAIGWAGFDPLFDNRDRHDLTGQKSGGSQTNVADSLAVAAVLGMGEANEQTPVAIIRRAPYVQARHTPRRKRFTSYEVPREEDIFAPFLNAVPWKKGGKGK